MGEEIEERANVRMLQLFGTGRGRSNEGGVQLSSLHLLFTPIYVAYHVSSDPRDSCKSIEFCTPSCLKKYLFHLDMTM